MAKTTPYPPRTGIVPWPTGTDLWRCYRRVTPTNYTAGPLCLNLRLLQDRLDMTKRSKHNYPNHTLILYQTLLPSTKDTPMVFANQPRQFYLDMTNSAPLWGHCHLDNFVSAGQILPTYQDFAKTRLCKNLEQFLLLII